MLKGKKCWQVKYVTPQITIIIVGHGDPGDRKSEDLFVRKARESFWIQKYDCVSPNGLNIMP